MMLAMMQRRTSREIIAHRPPYGGSWRRLMHRTRAAAALGRCQRYRALAPPASEASARHRAARDALMEGIREQDIRWERCAIATLSANENAHVVAAVRDCLSEEQQRGRAGGVSRSGGGGEWEIDGDI